MAGTQGVLSQNSSNIQMPEDHLVPSVQRAKETYETAGMERIVLELQLKAAKNKGDTNEVDRLTPLLAKAQEKVEAAQAEYKKELKLASAKEAPQKKAESSPVAKKPAFEKSPPKAFFFEVKRVLIHHNLFNDSAIRKLLQKTPPPAAYFEVIQTLELPKATFHKVPKH